MSTVTGTATLWPNGWEAPLPTSVWIAINGFTSATYKFDLSGTITPANGTAVPYSAKGLTGMGSAYNAIFSQVSSGSAPLWPITIKWTVTSDSPTLSSDQDGQYSLGAKGNQNIPISQMVPLFINDAGSDADFNDLVVFFQAYTTTD